MKLLKTKQEIDAAINDYINEDGYHFFMTPLISGVKQYPFSNLIFVNSEYNEASRNEIQALIYKNNALKKSDVAMYSTSMRKFNLIENLIRYKNQIIENISLVHFLKLISLKA